MIFFNRLNRSNVSVANTNLQNNSISITSYEQVCQNTTVVSNGCRSDKIIFPRSAKCQLRILSIMITIRELNRKKCCKLLFRCVASQVATVNVRNILIASCRLMQQHSPDVAPEMRSSQNRPSELADILTPNDES